MTHFSPHSPAVSVLVAAHNGEKTLQRAIESAQNQGERNIEVVVVDAGSRDNTARMLDVMSERDIRVVVSHEEDAGCAAALNHALAMARGRYVMVMGQDAWVEPMAIAHMLKLADDENLELVFGGLYVELSCGRRTAAIDAPTQETVFLTQHDFRANAWRYLSQGQLSPACGKLFLRSRVLDLGLSFDEDAFTDHNFTRAYLADVERVGVSKGYAQRISRQVPVMSQLDEQTFERRGLDCLEAEYAAAVELYRHWGLEGDAASMEALQNRYLEFLANVVSMLACAPVEKDQAKERQARLVQAVTSERARFAASVANPKSGAAKTMAMVVNAGKPGLAGAQAKVWNVLHGGLPASLMPDFYL